MRWSKFITSTFAISTLALTGCFDNSSSKSPGKPTPGSFTNYYQSPSNPNSTPQSQTSVQTGDPKTCYQNLCQGEMAYGDLIEKSKRHSQEQTEYFEKYVRPMIAEAMKLRYEEQVRIRDLVIKHKPDFEKVQLSEIQNRVMKTMMYIVKRAYFRKSELEQLSNGIANLKVQKAFENVPRNTGASAYFKALHPDLDVQQAAVLEAKWTLDTEKSLNKAANIQFFSITNTALLRARDNEPLDTADLALVMNASYGMHIAEALMTGELANILDSVKRDSRDYLDIIDSKNLLEQFGKYEEYEDAEMRACETKFYQAVNLSPTKDQTRAFEEKIDDIKDATLKLIRTDNPAYKVVERATFNLPFAREDIPKAYLKYNKNKIAGIQNSIKDLKTAGVIEGYLYAFLLALSKNEKEAVCESPFSIGLDDAMDSELGNSRLSWVSVMYPEYGAGIVAHEIGHIVFKHSNEHDQQKQCLSAKQGTNKYTNEDFSDWLSVKVEQSLQGRLGLRKVNYGCFLASLSIGQGLTNMDKTDVHSSDLYRALQIALNRKESLPGSCEGLALQENPKALDVCQ